MYVCMYVWMGGERAARSTLCIESIQACQYSGGATIGDVGVAIGQLQEGQHNKRQYTERVAVGGSRGGNNGADDTIISRHSA